MPVSRDNFRFRHRTDDALQRQVEHFERPRDILFDGVGDIGGGLIGLALGIPLAVQHDHAAENINPPAANPASIPIQSMGLRISAMRASRREKMRIP